MFTNYYCLISAKKKLSSARIVNSFPFVNSLKGTRYGWSHIFKYLRNKEWVNHLDYLILIMTLKGKMSTFFFFFKFRK